jgi:hypothetical protein
MLTFSRIYWQSRVQYWLTDQRPITQKVFWYLDENADWRFGHVVTGQSAIAEYFNTSERNIRLAVSALKDAGIVRGDKNIYALNPDVIWGGYDKDKKNATFWRLGGSGDGDSRVRFNPQATNKITANVDIEILEEIGLKTSKEISARKYRGPKNA